MKKVNLVKVFIASPSDVSNQRDDIENLIYNWNNEHTDQTNTILMPIRWENNSNSEYKENTTGQTIINEQIVSSSDLMIALFGFTLGTPVNNSKSGTMNEIEFFYKKMGARIGVFFLNEDNIPRKYLDTIKEVEEYRKEFMDQNKGLYETYSVERVRQFLTKEVNKLTEQSEEEVLYTDQKVFNSQMFNLFDEMEFDDDERLLLIFSVDEGVQRFSVSNHTIKQIIDWETKNDLEKYLSERYYDTLDKLEDAEIVKKEFNEETEQLISYSIERNKKIEIKKYLKANAAKINGIKQKRKSNGIINFREDSLPF